MGRFLTTRRSQWAPGIAVLGAAIGIAGAIGLTLSIRSWASYVGLTIAVALLAAWAGKRSGARRERERALAESPPQLDLDASQDKPTFDLERDASTDHQKYLM